MPTLLRSIAALLAACLFCPPILSSIQAAPQSVSHSHGSVDSTRPAVAYQLQTLRVNRAPSIDGRLDEEAWEEAGEVTRFAQFTPDPGAPMSRPTRVSVLYDDTAIYVGARMVDHPDSVVARVAQRDDFGHSDRFLAFFDCFNDDRTAFGFGVTPAGSRIDVFFSGDTGNGDPDWDPVWTAKAQVDSLGWTAEMKIPLSQLRYDPGPKDESRTWGFNAGRDIARHDERGTWAPLDPEANRFASLFGSLNNLRGLPSTTNLEVMPYTAGTAIQDYTQSANPLSSSTEWKGNLGGDVRYGVTPNLSLRATINPDFGQVEADPSQINLTAFETFFPEKRPFFVEGSDIFSVPGPRLFYSRRIGHEPQGTLPAEAQHADVPDRTTILGAAKLTGQTTSGWEIGALEAMTAQEHATYLDPNGEQKEALVAPHTNYSATRVRKNSRGGRSTVGTVLTTTNRIDLPERLNYLHEDAYAGGIDGRHRFADETYEASAAVYGSLVRGHPTALQATQRAPTHYYQRPDANHLSVDSTRTALAGWSARTELDKIAGRWRWNAEAAATSPGFDINDLGYLRSADELSEKLGVTYVNTTPGNSFRRIQGWLRQESSWTFGRERTSTSLAYGISGTLKTNYRIRLQGKTRFSHLSTTTLRGGPALRRNGRTEGQLFVGTDERSALRARVTADVHAGLGTDEYGISLQSDLRYRPSPRASVSIGPSVRVSLDPAQYVSTETVSSSEPQESPHTYLFGELSRRTLSVTSRASYAFTPKMTLSVYAQPFVATGDYQRFAELEDPRATRFEKRFGWLDHRISRDDAIATYHVDSNDGASYSFPDPDFSVTQLRSTVVFKWEYRRGSALHLVWNHEGSHSQAGHAKGPGQALEHLFASGRNTFVVKINYWFGL